MPNIDKDTQRKLLELQFKDPVRYLAMKKSMGLDLDPSEKAQELAINGAQVVGNTASNVGSAIGGFLKGAINPKESLGQDINQNIQKIQENQSQDGSSESDFDRQTRANAEALKRLKAQQGN